jgi:hypothetical protein
MYYCFTRPAPKKLDWRNLTHTFCKLGYFIVQNTFYIALKRPSFQKNYSKFYVLERPLISHSHRLSYIFMQLGFSLSN